jgi:hypothetical protein
VVAASPPGQHYQHGKNGGKDEPKIAVRPGIDRFVTIKIFMDVSTFTHSYSASGGTALAGFHAVR